MKNLLRVMAVLLAVGSMAQAVCNFNKSLSVINPVLVEDEANLLTQLIELKKQSDLTGIPFSDIQTEAGMPEIKSNDDFKEQFLQHTLKYLQTIKGGENTVQKVLKQQELQPKGCGPGI
ncbi:MAG: hypothetical protein A2504_12995 [Bdellovibrionales bacterium RIFOXYD12_FULL_39_22]|nr:MAG: hypothetical protein A2385_00795 [Bdellovibrionales bacterium RIFOXYB1_FULL_39_21]OFZ43545.1 MAG: hypothetical protein A2485_12465 [Bdellovibrionales bacterium RIFOXYC12_FULL_39_17]OFZ44564.1 MAG: hypothetical protein A2404_10155 [Bdellovibrionales bacterium RIFOXYC1_FULL_39_130]OFZ76323.1 MAG: hypothetical protein A2560_06775 [Bdellovibrionales bacterium RIFOXYD1_FULL_39_84]OFZ94589.1 MAG: hypothetical protein A2504_12995 [Bdellovibrionales bacterium RIFOXYD12_FULL_39_22]HLE12957.1 hy